jgi:hypothetical protein
MKQTTADKLKAIAYLIGGSVVMGFAVSPAAGLALGISALGAMIGAVAIAEERIAKSALPQQPQT